MNYYNEYEPFAAEWIKELIREGLIPDGEVDTRSIVDVEPGDLKDFTQCHFFAGIGGWAYAARLAGWRDDRPMWTGSPPCQPFSVAGKQKGTDDERHLWPVWFRLLRECKPAVIFGEQVAAAIQQGWLDSLQEDLEAEGYACAAAVLPASGVGALHKRDRLWIVAHASGSGRQGWGSSERGEQREIGQDGALCPSDGRSGEMADTNIKRQQKPGELRQPSDSEANREEKINRTVNDGGLDMADSNDIGHQWNEATGWEAERRSEYASQQGFWDGVRAVQCNDGKVRAIPTEPEIFPLANGISNRVGILRGAGNAIVPQVAAEIIKVFV